MSVSVNFYGSGADSDVLGRQLSRSKVWLQKPDWFDAGTRYQNPPMLHVPLEFVHDEALPLAENTAKTEEATLQDSVAEIYSMLTRDAHLENVNGGESFLPS